MAAQFARTIRSLHQESSRLAWLAWGLAAMFLLAWLAWFCLARVTVYEISRKARLEVRQSAQVVYSAGTGRILNTRLQMGRDVQAGDILVEMDARSEMLRLGEEEARLQAIPARIELLGKEIALLEQALGNAAQSARAATESARLRAREAGVSLEFARDQQRRLQAESEQGSVARVEAMRAAAEAQKLGASHDALSADARRLEADAQMQHRQHQAHIEGLRRSKASLEAEMQTTRSAVARLRVDIDKRLIRAPVAGRIGEVAALREGAFLAEGQKLATLVPGGDLMAVADFVPAAVLGRVHVGQLARMRLDGFPWTQYGTLEAQVSRVASEVRDGLIRVEFRLAAPRAGAPLMQHGLPGAIEVSIDEAAPAILLLRAAGQSWGRAQAPAAAPLINTAAVADGPK